MPRPGKGIAEYREVTRLAQRAVANTVDSLEAVRSGQHSSELARFDRAVEQLELTSIKARARADAIMARGQNYFDEWKEQLGTTNQSAAQANYNRLYDHFTRVRQRSSDVREDFRPFMAKLRHFRAQLDGPANPPNSETARIEIDALKARGQRVLNTLEAVSTALNDAETELHAFLASKR